MTTFEKLIEECKNSGLRVIEKTDSIRIGGSNGYLDVFRNEWNKLDEQSRRFTLIAIVTKLRN